MGSEDEYSFDVIPCGHLLLGERLAKVVFREGARLVLRVHEFSSPTVDEPRTGKTSRRYTYSAEFGRMRCDNGLSFYLRC